MRTVTCRRRSSTTGHTLFHSFVQVYEDEDGNLQAPQLNYREKRTEWQVGGGRGGWVLMCGKP